MRRCIAGLSLLLAAACAHYPDTPRLAEAKPDYGYRFANTAAARGDDTFVIVTMSGGGTRAAALAYGVLEKLKETQVRGGVLLDTVDVVSSVSGGSFTAMWYALHGPENLSGFKKAMLYKNVEGGLFRSAFGNPRNWFRLLSPHFSRIDVAAELYDREIFDGATFEKIPTDRRPYTTLNASEMDIGSQFQFTQEQFDTICGDLTQVKVARAVAASSAFPGLLTPLTLQSRTGKCSYTPPAWFALAAKDIRVDPWRHKYQNDLAALMNPQRAFIQLMDGGIADNIGLRTPMYAIKSTDTLQHGDTGFSVLRLIDKRAIKRVVVIIVNAKTQNQLKLDKSSKAPGLISALSTASNTPLGNYSFDTVAMLADTFAQRRRDARTAIAAGVTDFPQVDYYPIEVAFRFIEDPEKRHYFETIGTNFHLPEKEVDDLIGIGKKLLEDSPAFKELVRDLQ